MSKVRASIDSPMALVLATLLASASPSTAEWVVTEVPQQAGWTGDTELYDVSDHGEACGTGNYISGVSSVAFRFDGTTVTELPYLHPAPATYAFAWASAINNNGVVAGRSHNAAGVDRAVFWTGTTITEIPLPADANTSGDMRGEGINDAGVVVGFYSSTTTGYPAAFYYDGTTHSLVAPLQAAGLTGERSYAEDVNNNGLISGHAENVASDYVFYTYDIDTGTVTVIGQLFPAVGFSYFTSGMNDLGHIVGRGRAYIGDPTIHALLHDGSWHVVDETVVPSQWARGITNAGRIVGRAGTSSSGAWAWYSDGYGLGSMIPVDLAGWSNLGFQGINSGDVMVGAGNTVASPSDDRGLMVAPPPGDAEHDGDVDFLDFSVFQNCFATTGPVAPGCGELDFEPDGDVDLTDYVEFESHFLGVGQ
jgi:probable HAF family extracellular repeat protein